MELETMNSLEKDYTDLWDTNNEEKCERGGKI